MNNIQAEIITPTQHRNQWRHECISLRASVTSPIARTRMIPLGGAVDSKIEVLRSKKKTYKTTRSGFFYHFYFIIETVNNQWHVLYMSNIHWGQDFHTTSQTHSKDISMICICIHPLLLKKFKKSWQVKYPSTPQQQCNLLKRQVLKSEPNQKLLKS